MNWTSPSTGIPPVETLAVTTTFWPTTTGPIGTTFTATPIFDIDQLLDDPHVQARGVIVEVPDDEAGSVLMHNVIPRLSDTPGRLRTPAPALGQHTHAVLQSIGYDAVRLAGLAAAGAIKES